jgi:hypothetical protein
MIIGDGKAIENIDSFDFKFKTTYDEQERLKEIRMAERPNLANPFRVRKQRVHGGRIDLYGRKIKFYNHTTKPKKTRNTENKRRSQYPVNLDVFCSLQSMMRSWFWQGDWRHKHQAFNELLQPISKLQGSWKLLYWRYNNNFYQILIKLLQIKMNGGFNDNSHESKNSEQCKTKRSKPTLRRNEGLLQGIDPAIVFDVEAG